MVIYSDIKDCACLNPPFNFDNYTSTRIGTDETNGRFGEVSIEKCKKCGRLWLKYKVEYEGFSNSGRWYRCQILEAEISKITPENAVDFLKKSDECFFGGSYFQTDGKRMEKGTGEINVDL